MACSLTKGIKRANICKAAAGIKNVYFGQYLGSDLITTISATTKEIETITAATPATLPTYYLFENKVAAGSFTENTEATAGNNSIQYSITTELVITALTAEALDIMKTLDQGYWTVIVELNDGKYVMYGIDYPAEIITRATTTGSALNDARTSTITVNCVSKTGSYVLSADAFESLTIA